MSLAYELTFADASPTRWMLFLHGVLGRRANWRSFSRKWVAARPGWGAVLVDLRDHGESQGLPGPRTVAAAGADLVAVAAEVRGEQGGRIAGVLGHSFGGKVAIEGAAALRRAGHGVDELWILDAPVGPRSEARPGLTDAVFACLHALPPRFDTRGDFVDAVVGAGISSRVAQWLATNLVEVVGDGDGDGEPGGFRFGLDLDRVGALVEDFARVDLWPTLEAELAAGVAAALVVGERSEAVVGEELARAQAVAAKGDLRVLSVPRAGHWLHVENPAGLLEQLT